MQAYIRNNPRTRYLPTSGLNELAKDIAKLCQNYKPAEVLVNLSDNDLTMNFVQELIELLDRDEHLRGTLALDLSLNRIQAGWEEIASAIASLLKKPLVQNLNLSFNYLPELETMNDNPAVKQELCSYGTRLSLGYDYQELIGEPDGLLDTECSSIQAGRLWQTGKLVSLPTGTCSGMETLETSKRYTDSLFVCCAHI